ncbi:MAG: flavin reductase family protein [Bauldia sp.]|nr:flavin reductase family protein [Bauldia sp.]
MSAHGRVEADPAALASAESFRAAMRSVAGGVTVITAGAGDDRSGLTATSVVSVCLEPPTVLVCVNRSSSTWPLIQRYRHFGVNVLASHHEHVANQFAGRDGIKGPDRYANADWLSLSTGALILADAIIGIDCEVDESIDRATHSIILGRVKAVHAPDGGDPLLYWRGDFGRLTR